MPGKTKNRRAKRSNRGKTRSQRGGLSIFGWEPEFLKSDPNSSSSFEWPDFKMSDFNPFKSDPNGKGWWDTLTSPATTTTASAYDSSDVKNPMQQSYVSSAPVAPDASSASFIPPASPDESSLSNDSFSTKYGGKRSKSRKCHRKHKHTKCCKN